MPDNSLKLIARGLTPPFLAEAIRRARHSGEPGEKQGSQEAGRTQTPHGEFQHENLAAFRALYENYFSQEAYRFQTSAAKPLIIDGGANIGVSCRYWKHLYPQAEVIGFEPDEHVFKLMQANMAGQSGFTAKRMALWSSDDTFTFNAVGGEGGHLEAVATREKTDFKKVGVPTFRLRNLLEHKVDLLKLDIEGAELEVLRDCKDRLQNVEKLFVEHHSFLGRAQQLGEFFEILEAGGFRVHLRVDLISRQPFMHRTVYNHKDSWLNVFAFRE